MTYILWAHRSAAVAAYRYRSATGFAHMATSANGRLLMLPRFTQRVLHCQPPGPHRRHTQQIARIGYDGLALGRVAELALDEIGEVTQQHRGACGAVKLRLVQRALDGVAEARQLVAHAASFGGGGQVTPSSRVHS